MRKNIVFVALLALSVLFASPTASVTAALSTLGDFVCNILGTLVGVLVVLAAVAYAAGHIMGQETGARAKVWAQNLLIGAGIGLVIYLVAPLILNQLLPSAGATFSC
ncbi:MAG: hypothetical protein D6769_00205 [Methanobacteriota archaeon]|nr:MAG: hypothetical protein D6769_00205 [Euryarchaeota archaeon]